MESKRNAKLDKFTEYHEITEYLRFRHRIKCQNQEKKVKVRRFAMILRKNLERL